MAAELRFRELERRLAEVERALADLSNAAPAAVPGFPTITKTKSKLMDDDDNRSSDMSVDEMFGTAVFMPSGDEVRGGVTTMGPCYEIQQSIWDACLVVGLPIISHWDSAIIVVLTLMNIVAQVGFVYIVKQYMSESILGHEQLQELVRFRTNIAHDVKYADLGTGRSLARQVCGLDEQLPWASTQFTAVDNLQNYAKTGTLLALLAIGCWLATTLREVFNISGFVAALRGYEAGPYTVLVESEEGDEVKIATMSRGRRNMLFIFVAFPRLLVAFSLMDTGTRYLANTLALEDLILNAVALAFILDLDELIESAFAPRRARFVLDELHAMPIPRIRIPCYGKMSAGLQERAKNAAKIFLLIGGMALAYMLLLLPLQERINLAINILCGGEKDFIYAVNPATGIVETTPTFKEQQILTHNQRTVLRLANPPLYPVHGWEVTQEQLDHFYDSSPPALRREHPLAEGGASMELIEFLEQLDNSDVKEQALLLPCMDESFSPLLVRPHLQRLAGVASCAEIKTANLLSLCSRQNMSSLRALCPETCGCDNAFDPLAGAFATATFGCPKRCVWKSLRSDHLKKAPCRDWTAEEFISNPYTANFMTGMFQYVLNKEELKHTQSLQYESALKEKFWDLLPGPNKTESLARAVDHYMNLGWMEDLVQRGEWNIGWRMPHPRGLKGCAFFASSEVKTLTGISICRDRSEFDDFRGLRAQCALTCECRSGQVACPRTCPVAIE